MPMYYMGETVSDGAPGPGIPPGGTDGQALLKDGDESYKTRWGDIAVTPATQEKLIAAPKGAIMGWTDPDNIPDGWHICDGEDGTLDLRGKFLFGANENYAVGDEGGEENVTLTISQMPRHDHGLYTQNGSDMNRAKITVTTSNATKTGDYTAYTGGSQPHNNMPPYRVVVWIQKMVDDPEPVTMYIVKCPVGCVMIWSGTADNIPRGWAPCDGQDGRPDFRDLFVLGAGPNHPVDEAGGEEKHVLTVDEMPQHRHVLKGYRGNEGNTFATVNTQTASGTLETAHTEYEGKNQPHNNMPPYISKLYIIKIAPDETDGVTMEQVNEAIDEKLSGIAGVGTGGGVPAGFIGMWSGSEDAVPSGWALCNGENGTPDLRGRFVLGANEDHPVGQIDGEETHMLTIDEIPSHSHNIKDTAGENWYQYQYGDKTGYGSIPSRVDKYTKDSGGGQPHNNMPPYYVLCYIMKLPVTESTT